MDAHDLVGDLLDGMADGVGVAVATVAPEAACSCDGFLDWS
jgi:hypothetical protein